MRRFVFPSANTVVLLVLGPVLAIFAEEIPEIPRRLPPTNGIVWNEADRAALEKRSSKLSEQVWTIDYREYSADVGVLTKAVEFALDHNEFYSEKEIPVATELLDIAEQRIKELEKGEALPSWLEQRGLVIRGYRSNIDDSYQPYGLEIPETLDLSKPVPLLVWLHGRGDKITDMHFLQRCRTKSQAMGGFVKDQQEAIILHPFGRQCVGWKHAGEIDIFEAIDAIAKDYPIDPDRIVLAGFSMGGAGAWHVGAHYRDRFCAVHAGAGFAETKEYNRLTPEKYGPDYVQTLWQVYDVPNYIRNFLNGPVLAYSGSDDKQKQAADLVERELKKVGYDLRHVVGEGMGHKYNEESVKEIWAWLEKAWETGRPKLPDTVQWQTPTLRYPGYDWLQLQGLEEHWKTAMAKATWDRDGKTLSLDLQNVSSVKLNPGPSVSLVGQTIRIGGSTLSVDDPKFRVEACSIVRQNGKWDWGEPELSRKRPGIQGPIDDAFMSRFVVVPPDSDPVNPTFARWVDFELRHFRSRWKGLMRGEMIEHHADELDSGDIADANLILWGGPDSNKMIKEIADKLPVSWEGETFTFRGKTWKTGEHVPVLIFPNPLNPGRYVVINSGLTFREGHDSTNSQQNPKLPDWAIVGLDQLPDANGPGRIVEAGFFNEEWR
ncbi:MAG: hypothetical protein CMO55_28315 [Verrucomicrobiales bacterium]|nr:hypothetical protein [Verrucomicrobiales bacterium]